MIVVKRILRAPSIEVNHPAHSIGKEQWNAESRPHSGRLQAGGLSEGAALEVVQQKASSFGGNLFQQCTAHSYWYLGSLKAIPGCASGNLSSSIKKQDGGPLRGYDVEQHPQ